MQLDEWAKRWGVHDEALAELNAIFQRVPVSTIEPVSPSSEKHVQNTVRLEASKKGCWLWRNNVGAAYTNTNQFFRYGLANESKAMNDKIKSADLIGIRPIMITANMIGTTIGQFLSREVKPSNWKFTGTDREAAQLKWAQLVVSLGGDACFANREGTL
jgi:hypothetical protein